MQNDPSLKTVVSWESPLIPCNIEHMQVFLLEHYWLHFGYHREETCLCTRDMKTTRRMAVNYPMQCPISMGEMSGKYQGWVDEKLAVLTLYISAINVKFHEELIEAGTAVYIDQILKYLLTVRSTYWYYVTNEKKRYMTEILFAERLQTMSQVLQEKETQMFFLVDEGFKKNRRRRNIWWETFLHHMSDFYRRLRWSHYQIINISLPEHKQDEFGALKRIHSYAMDQLSRPVDLLLPGLPDPRPDPRPDPTSPTHFTYLLALGETEMKGNFLVTLPKGSTCFICTEDLSNHTAAWQLQTPIHHALWEALPGGQVTVDTVRDIILVRYTSGLPIIFEDANIPDFPQSDSNKNQKSSFYVVCGNHSNSKKEQQNCLLSLVNHQMEYFDGLAKLTINWIFKTQKCHGCLKFCYESHRCSGCRALRYCSKDCLTEDWKVHAAYCKEMSNEPNEALLNTVNVTRFEGEKKNAFYQECLDFLNKVDPYFRYFSTKWETTGLTLDDIITEPVKKSKRKTKKSNDSSSGGESTKKEKKKKEKKSVNESLLEAEANLREKHRNACCNGKKEVGIGLDRIGAALSKSGFDASTMKVTDMSVFGEQTEESKDVLLQKLKKCLTSDGLHSEVSLGPKSYSLKQKPVVNALGFEETFGRRTCISKETKEKDILSTFVSLAEMKIKERGEEEENSTVEVKEESCDQLKEESTKELTGKQKKKNKPKREKGKINIEKQTKHKPRNAKTTKERSKEDIQEEQRKLEIMMKSLPKDAKKKLCDARAGKDHEAALTKEEYNEMWSIVGPYMPKDLQLYDPSADEKEVSCELVERLRASASKSLEEEVTCTIDKESVGGSDTISGLIELFRNEILGKHFEIRHIKTHTWMNSRICKVEDTSVKSSSFDPRVVCSIKGDETGKQYSLRIANMVDYCAHTDDLVGTNCVQGSPFRKTKTVLSESYIAKTLHDSMQWLDDRKLWLDESSRREHQVHRYLDINMKPHNLTLCSGIKI